MLVFKSAINTFISSCNLPLQVELLHYMEADATVEFPDLRIEIKLEAKLWVRDVISFFFPYYVIFFILLHSVCNTRARIFKTAGLLYLILFLYHGGICIWEYKTISLVHATGHTATQNFINILLSHQSCFSRSLYKKYTKR